MGLCNGSMGIDVPISVGFWKLVFSFPTRRDEATSEESTFDTYGEEIDTSRFLRLIQRNRLIPSRTSQFLFETKEILFSDR